MRRWLDKPNKEGWWWCLQNERSDIEPNKLAVVYVYDQKKEWEENYPEYEYPENDGEPFGIYCEGQFVGHTGLYSGDIVGKWYGPIEPPPGVDNIEPPFPN